MSPSSIPDTVLAVFYALHRPRCSDIAEKRRIGIFLLKIPSLLIGMFSLIDVSNSHDQLTEGSKITRNTKDDLRCVALAWLHSEIDQACFWCELYVHQLQVLVEMYCS